MKLFTLILFTFIAFFNLAQTTYFKDNLFNYPQYGVEVTEDEKAYKMSFYLGDSIDSVLLYRWEYATVLNAFTQQFKNVMREDDASKQLFDDGEIVKEAGRVFFLTQEKITMPEPEGKGPTAGTFGFVNKEVVARRSIEYKRVYRMELHAAKKAFRKGETEYSFFVNDSTSHKIKDTLFDKTRSYWGHYLKKKEFGVKSYANSQINKFYASHYFSIQNRSLHLKKVNELIGFIELLERDDFQSLEGKLKLINQQIETDSLNLITVNDSIAKLEKQLASAEYMQFENNKSAEEKKAIAKKNPKLYDQFFLKKLILSELFSSQLGIKSNLDRLRRDRELIELKISIVKDATDSVENIQSLLKEYNKKYNLTNLGSLEHLQNQLANQQLIQKEIQDLYGTSLISLSIDSISVKIDKTFIESIAVYTKILASNYEENNYQFRNKSVMFYNHQPISISTLTSIDKALSSTSVFAFIENHLYEIDIRDIIAFYNPIQANGRNDLSPADTTFTLVKNNGEQTISVNKTPTQKLFEMKVYSDFVGLNGTTPNGLVQLEFSKEMYLSSQKYTKVFKKGFYFNNSWGTYVTPFFTLSKLEKTNKFLPLLSNDSTRGAQTLQLKRYEIFSVGADINLFAINVPRWKTQLFIDPGIAFARIGLADSVLNSDSVMVVTTSAANSFAIRSTAKFVFQTDERYFFDARLSFQWYRLLDKNIQQIKEQLDENFTGQKAFSSKLLFNIGLNAGFSPTSNTKGKLFIRYNYYGLAMERALQGFSQIQLGYSYYLNN